MMTSKLVVLRRWDNPNVQVYVSADEISLELPVKSFISALAAEVGNPTMLMTKKQLLDALLKASDRVVGEVKQASVHV